jgi:hypothetical protein
MDGHGMEKKGYYVPQNSIQLPSLEYTTMHACILGSSCMSLNYCSAFSGLALGCQTIILFFKIFFSIYIFIFIYGT